MAGGQKGIWIGVAAVVVAGIAAVAGVRMMAPAPPPEESAAASPAAVAERADPSPASGATAAHEAPPPWLGDSREARPGTLQRAEAQAAEAAEHSRRALADLQARSEANEAGIRASIAKLDELQSTDGAAAGVNLDALRGNLEVALQMQRITREVQELSLQPAGEARVAAMRAKVDELNRLQGQLRYDIGAQPPAPVARQGAE